MNQQLLKKLFKNYTRKDYHTDHQKMSGLSNIGIEKNFMNNLSENFKKNFKK